MERIDFLATDGIILNGILYYNKQKAKDVILSVHGMSSNCFKDRDKAFSECFLKEGYDYFCFNNRGSELVKYIRKDVNGNKEKKLGGTTYEDVLEGYEDIVGAILKLKELGYQNIHLQGHSLGCTKIVYTYNELKEEESNDILENIKSVILLSLIDIPQSLKIYLGNRFDEYLNYAIEKEQKNEKNDLMPKDSFIHPISVKSFLRYARDNKEIDFARYGRDSEFIKLNNIDVPLFMRWGDKNEMIIQRPDELVNLVSNNILNDNKNIGYIEGADHGYTGKEEIVANQIIDFIKNN